MGGGGAPTVCVCVPVRNERRGLPRLMAALARQREVDLGAVRLCLHLDSCTDGSEAVAAELARAAPFGVALARGGPSSTPNAGRARRAAMRMGLARLGDLRSGVLLSTDADSAPAPDWVAQALRALAQADVATGRVERDGAAHPTQDHLEAYLDLLQVYRRQLDPVPWEAARPHHFTSGANLAFRPLAYLASGGFGPHANGEDALIVDEAHRAGLRVRRDPTLSVRTSSRLRGRASAGLAAHLRGLGRQGADAVSVMHPADAAWQYAGQAQARRAFESGRPEALASLANRLRAEPDAVRRLWSAAPNAESFAMRLVPAPPGARTVSLAEATRLLDRLVAVSTAAA